MPTQVAVAIGSNLGDRNSHLAFARSRLAVELAAFRMSSIRETAPVGVSASHPHYLNAVAVGETACSARELLSMLLALERERGRERVFPAAPRTLDLDLVLFGDVVVCEPGLVVPHPRFRDRAFVLEPLAEVAPDMVDPVTGTTVGELFRRLSDRG
jgi:2-amino-4-hydroxy-6-hydroxymethyldihydropteridine diphosphokinase